MELQDRVAIVTGAAGGIGRAVCKALRTRGGQIIVADYNEKAGKAAAEEVDGLFVAADLSRRNDCRRLVDAALEEFGRVDILINNAAFVPKGPITSYTKDMWEYTFSVNMTGLFICARELVARLLEDERPGKIVNIASQAAFRGSTTGHLPYD